ncbi:MAG: peptide synthase [Gemmatimonadetes bacterium]|nr:MAG: peptide synthase [Gemmatimonadota bacterium]
MPTLCNIAKYLPEMAQKLPYQRAVVFPEGRDHTGRVAYTHLTYRQLNQECDRYCHGLHSIGISRGTKVLLAVTPSLEFIALTFALFKMGTVPVLIDPGMGKDNLLNCVAEVQPDALIGIPRAHVAKLIYRKPFQTVKQAVIVGKKGILPGITLDSIRPTSCPEFPLAETQADDLAAIIFTTGSTGPPKGVMFTHGIFDAQVRYIRDFYQIKEGELDLAGFPLFALFDVAMGMTCVIPDMDPTRPAEVDPHKIVETIENLGITSAAGSPAIWDRVGKYSVDHQIKLPSLKRILMFGAPVRPDILERFYRHILTPAADTHTAYGATEALPVASIAGSQVVTETAEKTKRGAGTCVGMPFPDVEVKIIRISDEPIETWNGSLCVPPGTIGEIVIKGDIVTPAYYQRPDHTRLAKIYDAQGTIRHRIGDVGYFDELGRIWYCGRKSHRVITASGTLFTVPCEGIFNDHPAVFRSALVGVGERPNQQPVILIEKQKESTRNISDTQLVDDIQKMAAANPLTKSIKTVLIYPGVFPTDIRHNAKIFREKLALWAAQHVAA